MISSLFRNKTIIVILIIGVIMGAWYITSSSSSAQDTSTITTENATGGDTGVLESLLTLRAIKLEGGVLSNPAFATLKDFSVQIVSEPVGRTNPFAPLDGGIIPVAANVRDITIHTIPIATTTTTVPVPVIKSSKR